MIDFKDYDNEDLKELRKHIDSELFNRIGDISFSKYKIGDVYFQDKGECKFIYVVKDVDIDYIYAMAYAIYNSFLSENDITEYTHEQFKDKNLIKIDISEHDIETWYNELSIKVRDIDFVAEKEKNSLLRVYLKQLHKKIILTDRIQNKVI